MNSNLLILLLVILICQGCTTAPDKNPAQFIVRVDSISLPAYASTGDTVAVELFGTIGSDGCHSFSHFEDNKQALRLDLTVWGQRIPSDACPAVMMYLNGMKYSFVLTRQGWYSVNLHQPDGTILRDSINVN